MTRLMLILPGAAQLSVLVATVLGLTSAASAQTKPEKLDAPVILARGPAGTVVTTADVLAEMQRAPADSHKAFLAKSANVEQLVNNLLVRRALAKEAERDGLLDSTTVQAALQIARDRVLADARLARLDTQNEPSLAAIEAQAKKQYEANTNKYELPAQTRARHILLNNNGPESLAKAKELLTRLRSGASFEELAKTNSTDPGSAVRGGDLGFFGAGQMVRPFEDAVNALKNPGDLSEPIETQFGYHIIKLEERRPVTIKPFVDVKASLMTDARTVLLNEARVQKAVSLNNELVFDAAALETFYKAQTAKQKQ